jgi:sugar phosphate isomerase/epimerase
MQLGIFAKTFPGTAPLAVLNAAAAAGYACVQYNMACSGLPAMPDHLPEDAATGVATAARAAGVRIVAVSATYNMIHPDIAVRDQGLRRLEVLASRCASMGTNLLTLCTGTRDAEDQWRHHPDNDGGEAWQDLLAAMESAIAIAERHNVTLGIEPELANAVSSAAKARRLIDELRSPRIRIVLDAANLFEREGPDDQRRIVGAAIELLADRIVMAHAKDRDASGGFATAGSGVLDYRHYLGTLRAAGFNGPLVTHGLLPSEAAETARFLTRSLAEAGVE